MSELHPTTTKAIATLFAREFDRLSNDCLVMRLGSGTEQNNTEAVVAYLNALTSQTTASPADEFSAPDLAAYRFDRISRAIYNHLEEQSQNVWMLDVPGYPSPLEYLSQSSLTYPQCRQMAHALTSLFTGGRSSVSFENRCLAWLSGGDAVVERLSHWVANREPRYTHHPSELFLPLAKDLLLTLYPDYTAE